MPSQTSTVQFRSSCRTANCLASAPANYNAFDERPCFMKRIIHVQALKGPHNRECECVLTNPTMTG